MGHAVLGIRTELNPLAGWMRESTPHLHRLDVPDLAHLRRGGHQQEGAVLAQLEPLQLRLGIWHRHGSRIERDPVEKCSDSIALPSLEVRPVRGALEGDRRQEEGFGVVPAFHGANGILLLQAESRVA